MGNQIIRRNYDLVVVGGGLSGVCAAISAARYGLATALIHNRPVLGGNASSEIKMHVCGAAGVFLKRPNARETGIIEEILLENKRRNPRHNFSILDTVLWEKVRFQENLTLYLNCHVNGLKKEDNRITHVNAFQMTTEKEYEFSSPIFVDATGDAYLAHLAGAGIMSGMEGQNVFNEPHAPLSSSPYTMGNTLMFKAVDTGKPVKFVPPFWANKYSEEDLKHRDHSYINSGYWWIELGGTVDCTSDFEEIRDDLLKVVYGIWDHIKNCGDHGAENWDLEWVQFLPGKRESRRVIGDYILTENDLTQSKVFEDAVAYGGWPIDTHTPLGISGRDEGPNRFIELKDLYSIPYRCLYSRDIENLMVGGRAISASHLAFASTRVMGTTSVIGQAIGTACYLQKKYNLKPRELFLEGRIPELQQLLLKDDCYIPGVKNNDKDDLALKAKIIATSSAPDYPVENLLTGVSRPVKEKTNLWVSDASDENPEVTLKWDKAIDISEVILKFDSDLNQDLMISIDSEVINKWGSEVPATLVKSYQISMLSDGRMVKTIIVEDNCIRNSVTRLDSPVSCDELRVKLIKTYGSKEFRLFEVRVY